MVEWLIAVDVKLSFTVSVPVTASILAYSLKKIKDENNVKWRCFCFDVYYVTSSLCRILR